MAVKNKYGFVWVTGTLFLLSLVGHWALAWSAYVQEQEEHNEPVEVSGYVVETGRDTLENWQSEFLQLVWQVMGLSFLYYVGSSQSKEGDDRKEEKLDLILEKLDPKNYKAELASLDRKYPKK